MSERLRAKEITRVNLKKKENSSSYVGVAKSEYASKEYRAAGNAVELCMQFGYFLHILVGAWTVWVSSWSEVHVQLWWKIKLYLFRVSNM